VGVASVGIGTNLYKARPRNCFGRIYLVIVEREFRRFGLGRILVLTALDFLLDRFGETLYSISCLAAHEAIHRIMHSEIDFRICELACRNFIPVSVDLPKLKSLEFRREVHMALEKAVKLAAYRLRQKTA